MFEKLSDLFKKFLIVAIVVFLINVIVYVLTFVIPQNDNIIKEFKNLNYNNYSLLMKEEGDVLYNFKIPRIGFEKTYLELECEQKNNNLKCIIDKKEYILNIENFDLKKDIYLSKNNNFYSSLEEILNEKSEKTFKEYLNGDLFYFNIILLILGMFFLLIISGIISKKIIEFVFYLSMIILTISISYGFYYFSITDENKYDYLEQKLNNINLKIDNDVIIFRNVSNIYINDSYGLEENINNTYGIDKIQFYIDSKNNNPLSKEYSCKYTDKLYCKQGDKEMVFNVRKHNIMINQINFKKISEYIGYRNSSEFKKFKKELKN